MTRETFENVMEVIGVACGVAAEITTELALLAFVDGTPYGKVVKRVLKVGAAAAGYGVGIAAEEAVANEGLRMYDMVERAKSKINEKKSEKNNSVEVEAVV